MRSDDQERRAQARISAYNLDLLTRTPSKFSPSAPWIIPAMMILVVLFAFICIATRIILNYLRKKKNGSNLYGFSGQDSLPELGTTSTLDGKKGINLNKGLTRSTRKTRPLRLEQLTPKRNAQLKSISDTAGKRKLKSPSAKAMGRVARHEANRSLSDDRQQQEERDNNSDDITHDDGNISPTNISGHSDDTDEMRAQLANQADFVYKTAYEPNQSGPESGYPQQERHIVRMSSIEDYHQSATIRPTTESDI